MRDRCAGDHDSTRQREDVRILMPRSTMTWLFEQVKGNSVQYFIIPCKRWNGKEFRDEFFRPDGLHFKDGSVNGQRPWRRAGLSPVKIGRESANETTAVRSALQIQPQLS